MTISQYTLGCKVNQYDTEIMLEAFKASGYTVLPFGQKTDVVLINTCTVTGTGDNKSLKAVRRSHKENPDAHIIVAGCLAQREGETISKMPGVKVVLGTKYRARVVDLLKESLSAQKAVVACEALTDADFECSSVDSLEGRSRAVLKIQEGCKNRCAYCIIPSVRGGVRSRPIESIKNETERLARAGYSEIILTGIHLNSYGLDGIGADLTDAVVAALESAGEARIRLGSLEPTLYDERFASELSKFKNICPQFHLSLQSGSDSVLARMRRRYNTQMYEQTVAILRRYFPGCAITTDIITGFPGETREEFEETLAFAQKIGFAKIHVFPYSQREGTEAAVMSDQVDISVRQARARELIEVSSALERQYVRSKIGQPLRVIFEETIGKMSVGTDDNHIRCFKKDAPLGILTEFTGVREEGCALFAE